MDSPYLPRLAEILEIEKQTETERLFSIRLIDGEPLGNKPGQFVEVSVFGLGECPISICSAPNAGPVFELCIRNAGSVTGALHRLAPGDRIGIRGPYGTHYPVEELRGKDLLFVAGGLGIAPLRSGINYALRNRKDYGRITILFGARTPSDRLFKSELEELKRREDIEYLETVDISDETWQGNVGVITTLCAKVKIDPANTFAVVVGPPIMYRFVIQVLRTKGLEDDRIILSLERRMKCGQGKCGHCQMGPIYICREGPVVNYARVKDLEEALS
ncbi:MAG: FAD/NAD(P)-binding protein [Pseudomonadota bacterium]